MNTLGDILDSKAKIERGRYARICVELDLQKQLVPRIIAGDTVFNIEYEGLNLICFECGRYGHRREACSHKERPNNGQDAGVPPKQDTQTANNRQETAKSPAKMEQTPTDPFGPWMFVSKGNKARISKQGTHTAGQKGGGSHQIRDPNGSKIQAASRYAVLAITGKEEDDGTAPNLTDYLGKETATETQRKAERKDKGNGNKLQLNSTPRSTKLKDGRNFGQLDGNKKWKEKAIWEASGSVSHEATGLENDQVNGKLMGPNVKGPAAQIKPKMQSKRTHVIVAGNMGSMPNVPKQAVEEKLLGQGQAAGPNAPNRVFDYHEIQNRGPDLVTSSAMLLMDAENVKAVGEEGRPPDPGTNGDEEYWEEVETNLVDDQEDEIVPETLENR